MIHFFKLHFQVKKGTKWFITFVMTDCGLCSDMRPTIEAAALELVGEVKVGAVHCEKDMKICNRLNIPSVPWVKLLIPGHIFANTTYMQ